MNNSSTPIKNPHTEQRGPKPRTWPFLRCCPFADHLALLGDLGCDALTDPDIAHLLPRAHYLLVGETERPAIGPWWAR